VKLFRVFPQIPGAVPTDRGGALYVPPSSGFARIDNPALYDVLYVAHDPAAAIAEAFGGRDIWRPATFIHTIGGHANPYALATYELPDGTPIFNVNDIEALRSLGVTRPTDIVTRDRATTQAWAQTIFNAGGYVGVQWWSFYNPEWPVVGLWDRAGLALAATPEILTTSSTPVLDAAKMIVRQIAP
jgi:hypothetical protein